MTANAAAASGLQTLPGCEVKGRCEALLVECEPHPETRQVETLAVDLMGIPGTRHYGFSRKAGPREPWYPRNMEMRSGRQITAVSREELAVIAEAMQVERIEPEWIGANVVTSGIAHLSWLPAGTRLVFSEVAMVVEGQNAPCRISGRAIANHLTPGAEPGGLDLAFPKKARGLRGLLLTVERAGTLRAGEDIKVKVPPQTVWQSS
jgi:hypothetical protein